MLKEKINLHKTNLLRLKSMIDLFAGFKNWWNKRKEKKVVAKIDVGIPETHEDYDAHVYLKEKFNYSAKVRRSIIHNYKKQGGKLE